MAKKKTYYDPNNGQHYYHGETLGASNWGAPESDKDESYINQYNYTPSYNAYRQYLEEEKRREEEERRRIMHQQSYANPYEEPALKDPVKIRAGLAADVAAPEAYIKPKNPLDSDDFNKWMEDKQKAQTTIQKSSDNPIPKAKMDTPAIMSDKDKKLLGSIGESINNAGETVQQEAVDFSKLSTREKYNMYMNELEDTALKNGTLSSNQRVELSEYKYRQLNDKERKAIDDIMSSERLSFENYKTGVHGFQDIDKGRQSKQLEENARKTLHDLGWEDDRIDREVSRFKELEDYRITLEEGERFAIDPNASGAEKFKKGAFNTAYDIVSSPTRGISALLSEKGAYGRNLSSRHSLYSNTSQEALNQVRTNAIGNDRPGWQKAYDIGVSTGESLYNMLISQGVAGATGAGASSVASKAIEYGTLVPFSVNAYDSGYRDAVDRGFSESQAQGYALSVGALEALTEIFSLDKYWKMAEGTKIGRNLFTNAAAQAAIEGSEEVASDLGSALADYMAVNIGNTGKTQLQIDKEEIMRQNPGMSEEDVAREVAAKFVTDLGWSFVGGAAGAVPSSAIMVGVGAAKSKYGNRLNKAVSDRYQSLEVTGDTAYEEALKADKEKYQNNPTQFIADQYKAENEEGKRIKAGLQDIADKEKAGKKLTVSDKAFIADHAQVNKEFVEKLYDVGEDSQVPYEYRDVKTDVSENEARKMLAEAASKGDTNAFIDAIQMTRNSSNEEVAKNAEQIIGDYSGMAQTHGITAQAIGQARITRLQAYKAGLKGENLTDLSDTNKEAYNAGQIEAINQKARTTVESNALKNMETTTKEGKAVTLQGAFTSEGVQTSDGAVKLENIDLADNATAKAYQYADRYDNVNVKNAFISHIKDGQNIEQYRSAFDKMYDSAMAGVSYENAKNSIASKFVDEDVLKAAYQTGETERSARSYASLSEALGYAKAGKGQVVVESSKASADMVDFYDKLARRTGLTFKIVDEMSQEGARGSFQVSESTITVKADKATAVFHELGEFTETYNKKEYDALRNAIADFSSKKLGNDKYMRFLNQYKSAYEKAGQDSSADEMSGEMFNDTISIMMRSDKGRNALADYLAQNYSEAEAKTIGQQAANYIKKLAKAVKKAFSKSSGYEAEMQKYADELGEYADQFISALDKAIQNYQNAENIGDGEEKFSITVESTEEERYNELKDKIITIPQYNEDVLKNDGQITLSKLETMSLNKARKALKKLGERLGIFDHDYMTQDLDVVFDYSKQNLRESIDKQVAVPMNTKMPLFAKMLTGFDDVIKNAYLIEAHKDRYKNTPREDRNLRQMFVLASAFQDEVYIYPVKLEIKDFIKGQKDKLYVSIVLPAIEKSSLGADASRTTSSEHSEGELSSDYKLSDLLTKVKENPASADLGKYIPSQFKASEAKLSLDVDSQGKELTEGQKKYFADESPLLLDENGALKRYYHGTARMDRVGTVFDPARATSGPMAFFTDNKGIAENYAKDKEDTSLSRDERYDSYYTQFRLNINGKDVSVPDAWNLLPASKKEEIRQKAGHIAFDDDYEEIKYYPNKTEGNGAFNRYELNRHKGNYLETLVDTWLETGDLLDREEDFLEVLKLVGIDGAEYLDPYARNEGVYEVYLHVTNPLDTTNIPKKVVTALKKASKSQFFDDMAAVSDSWDKNRKKPQEWMDRLEDDIKDGTTHSWTSIPDWVTAVLKEQGYDGISDLGGKGGGIGHQVVIPFESNQVKNIDNENPTENNDIRFSIDVDEDRVYYAPILRGNLEIVKNATDEEYRQMREDILKEMPWLRGTDTPLLRHTYDEEGNTYYWSAADGIHAQVEPLINKHWNTRTSQHWEWWLKEDKDDYPIDYGTKYSIGGIGAFMADIDMLDKAREMEEAGETKDEIFDQTGWYRGADNMWKFEIDDSDAKVTDEFFNNYVKKQKYTLAEVMDFGELYKRYPRLGQMKVVVDDLPGNTVARYSSKDNTITIDEINGMKGYLNSTKSPEEELTKTLLHEIQHAIQQIEHFAAGSNPGMWARRDRGPVIYTRGDMEKYLQAQDELKELKEKSPKELVEGFKRIDWLTSLGEVLAVRDLYKELKAKYGDQFEEYYDADAEVKFFSPTYEELTAMEAYEMTAGEIEARDVEERHSWNKDMRKIIPTTKTNKGVLFAENMDDPWKAPAKFSLNIDIDSEGRTLTEGQQRYFNNSKALDENGALKVMYHGARRAGFTVFNADMSDDKRSFFFTDSADIAKTYSGTHEMFAPDKPMTFEELSEMIDGYTGGDRYLAEEGNDVVIYEVGMIGEDDTEIYRGSLKGAQEEFGNMLNNNTLNGDANYEVYLNLQNPLIMDAKGANWDELNQDAAWNKHFGDVQINKVDNGYDVEWMGQDFEWRHETFKSMKELEATFGKIYEPFEYGELFINDIYLDKDGNRIPTNTRMLSQMAQEQGHDGVIIKNLYDIGLYASSSEHKASTVAIAFNPEQIKSVYNLNPTSSEDIRYSLDLPDGDEWVDFDAILSDSSVTEEKAVDILEKGMEALKNKEVDIPKLRTLALKIRNEYGSSYNANTLTENLQKAFAYMQTEDHVDYKTMMGILKDIARPVIEQSGEKVGEQEYKDFLSYFKGKKIKLTEKQKEEVRYAYGTYGAFRNAMMPITISDNADVTLDQLWDEMVEQSGYMLDMDATEGDMPLNLLDTLQAMRPTVRNDFNGDSEDVARDLAMRIVQEYVEGEAAKEMKKEISEYRAKLKKDYQERAKKLRGEANAEARAKNKRRSEEAKEREEVRNLKHDIKISANKLLSWVEKPAEGKSVPHNMVVPVMQFLQAIDFVDPVITQTEDGKWHTRVFDHLDYENGQKRFRYNDLVGDTYEDVLRQFNEALGRGEGSKEQRSWTEKMQGIKEIYDTVLKDSDFEDNSMDFLMQTLDAQGLAEDLGEMLSRNRGSLNMNHLNSRDLKLIDNIIKNIFHAVNQGNKAYSSNVDIADLAQSTIRDAEGKEIKSRGKTGEGVYKMLRLDNVTPRTFFKLLGSRGSEVYKFIRHGLNQEIVDLKKASEFMEGAMQGIDARKWTGKDAVVHEFAISSGTIRMTDAQIMGLYCTVRRKGGMERIIGGIKVDDIVRKGAAIKQKNAMHLTQADIAKIESVLTPEQIALAKKMQKYMADDCSAMGNETSMKLYGFKKFTDDTYYPWKADRSTIATTNSSENIPMFTGIERSGFTKQLKEGANNPLVIRDIFDVFTDHVSEMASYHGYAASVKDTLRWLNYKEKDERSDGFVTWRTNKDAINTLVNDEQGVSYIAKLLLDINKANKSQYIGNFTDKLIGNYKAAAVGANLRVVAQQPTAYFRALNMIDPKYLMTVNPKKAMKNIKKSQEECPISWWKSKGYYETNLGQPIKEIVTGIASPAEKMKDIMMKPAGWADDFTWGFLYTAVEKEQRDKFKGQNISAEEFRKAVNERFDDVVDNTQVVDSTLHRSQYMRSNDRLNKLQTAFMAEPTKSYNMLLEAAVEDMREGKPSRTPRAVAAFLISSIATSAAAAVVDALRKTRDDEKWWEVWLNNLKENIADNVNPFNLLPVVKDVSAGIYNLFSGESTYGQSGNRFDIEAISSVTDAIRVWSKVLEGEGNKTGYGVFMSTIKPISQITGIPAYNMVKDSVALYNAFFDNIETNINSGSTAKNAKKKDFVSDVNKEKSEETLDQGIIDALNSGVSIYDLKGAVQSEYKNKYFDLYADGKEDEAKELADKAARAYARMGLSDEDIDEIINGWQEEVITYSALDKAIASGEGIEEEVKHVQEAKDDDKIIDHIMNRYTETVAFEDTHDTESSWRENVEKALQTVDPTLDFDTANEEAMQKRAEKEAKAEQTAHNQEMKNDFFDAVEKKDGSAGRKALQTMKDEGIEAKTVKSAVSTKYHDAWKEAKSQAEKDKAKSDWKSAYTLVNNVYGSSSNDLDQTWAEWEKKQK